jgi:hypothetical protein
MRILRSIFRVLDLMDAVYALFAFFAVIILLASGRIPHDLELWGYAVAGLILVVGLAFAVWAIGGRIRRSR